MIHVDVTIENTKSNLTLIEQSVAIYNKFLRGLDKPDLLLVLCFFSSILLLVCHSAVILITEISLFIDVNVFPRRNKEKNYTSLVSYKNHILLDFHLLWECTKCDWVTENIYRCYFCVLDLKRDSTKSWRNCHSIQISTKFYVFGKNI